MAEKKAKPDLYLSKDQNVEHLQWLHISLVSTAASKNNLYAVFAEHFMSLTYVTIRPETVVHESKSGVWIQFSVHLAIDMFHDRLANDGGMHLMRWWLFAINHKATVYMMFF